MPNSIDYDPSFRLEERVPINKKFIARRIGDDNDVLEVYAYDLEEAMFEMLQRLGWDVSMEPVHDEDEE